MKYFLMLFSVMCATLFCSAQINEIKRIPDSRSKSPQSVHDKNTGFWLSAEGCGGYSLQSHDNVGFGEIDINCGYRFNEYFRVGPGFGFRYYFPARSLRDRTYRWSFPLYLNIRGNLESMRYRDVIPYYSMDIGGSIQDGFMLRPTVGIRIGSPRKAFLLALSYVGQEMPYLKKDIQSMAKQGKAKNFVSFVALRIGYEY